MNVRIINADVFDGLAQLEDESVVIAYCAGVIDSDGTIGIRRNTYAMRVVGDCAAPTYCARICVRQVTLEALTILQQTFGGKVRPAKTYAKRGRLMYSWDIRDRIAEAALRKLLPHLRIKRRQAATCLRLRELIAESKRVRVARGRVIRDRLRDHLRFQNRWRNAGARQGR